MEMKRNYQEIVVFFHAIGTERLESLKGWTGPPS